MHGVTCSLRQGSLLPLYLTLSDCDLNSMILLSEPPTCESGGSTSQLRAPLCQIVLSAIATAGLGSAPVMAGCYALYLSFTLVGDTFLYFQ
jgi:hypothetical protein